LVFTGIGLLCFVFLYINFHPPFQLKTFSNLDHHFILHDGFEVSKKITLGNTDTVNFKSRPFNNFTFYREKGNVFVSSTYSEEPLYLKEDGHSKLISKSFATGPYALTIRLDSLHIRLTNREPNQYELSINNIVFSTSVKIKKGINAWNLFNQNSLFTGSDFFINEKLIGCLKSISFLREENPGGNSTSSCFFISGDLFRYTTNVLYNSQKINPSHLIFSGSIPDGAAIAWGIGFLNNNQNQYQLINRDGGFQLIDVFPVAYPLTAEDNKDWTKKTLTKFLVAEPGELNQLPGIFQEGFLFKTLKKEDAFSPVLLSYNRDKGDRAPVINARLLKGSANPVTIVNNKFELASGDGQFKWLFSVQDSFTWKFGDTLLKPVKWQFLIFGSLGFFFLVVLLTSILSSPNRFNWVWQLMSCILLLLLTTRFFLYWRYKSFPPFEEMDFPSVQQLQSFWNFGITVFISVLFAVIIGARLFARFFNYLRSLISSATSIFLPGTANPLSKTEGIFRVVRSKTIVIWRQRPAFIFFVFWGIVLVAAGGIAVVRNFETTTCRHLSIFLVLCYFIFLHYSYSFSPLSVSSALSWWKLNTGKRSDILINNPVKVLLSISLLGVFSFMDIGFAIIFLNFLLFNEAFFCINYSIAGYSAGSKRNSMVFRVAAVVYVILFAVNLTYGPYIFNFLIGLPQLYYTAGYLLFAFVLAYMITRLLFRLRKGKKALIGITTCIFLFAGASLFFPKERIIKKAAVTKYRIDILAEPTEKVIEKAYGDGQTYYPVIRAAQNQWFINTFITENNNPEVNNPFFHLLPHAPQNKGAKYNAQATDLVASRFLIAEHGKWAALFYIVLLLLPVSLLSSFYKLYPDFTNRINPNYPKLVTGFSIFNYLFTTALMVILAATGRYIFFGQDLPFASILSKQSVLFPALLIIMSLIYFRKIQPEQYPNRKKLLPGLIVFSGFAVLLFAFKPSFNRNKVFTVDGLATNMDSFIQLQLQPILDFFDTARATRQLSIKEKDMLFCDSVLHLTQSRQFESVNRFYKSAVNRYCKSGFSQHLDDSRLLFLDLHSGKPELAVNNNYFRVEPPPHLQQYWAGNVFSDSSVFNIAAWQINTGKVITCRINSFTNKPEFLLSDDLKFLFLQKIEENLFDQPCLVNISTGPLRFSSGVHEMILQPGDTLPIKNPDHFYMVSEKTGREMMISIQPDAFMKNLYVNGNRYYVYPMADRFIWARNFSESIASGYTGSGLYKKNAFISVNAQLMDSLTTRIKRMMASDTSYHTNTEYGICVADGNGRVLALADYIHAFERPDPNDKAGFNSAIRGENGIFSQSLLRKQIGNINLLRMNPGPGSTLKPIVFSAISSQMNFEWDAFSAEGFSSKKQYYGGEKVAPYDFEKNNGRIASVKDYLRYSDNYYYSNLLLLGSYSRQNITELLNGHFTFRYPEAKEPGNDPWPTFTYKGKQYWLDGFKNWPGYFNGKADFGSDSSFISLGLQQNFGIHTYTNGRSFEKFTSAYDSLLFRGPDSGFIVPELALFDQKGIYIDHRIPYDVFMSSFRGHVKGSSQVMIPPVKMTEAFGKLVSQNRDYALTLNPYADEKPLHPFFTGKGVVYGRYISLMKEGVFSGMKEVLYSGTASRLGALLKKDSQYYYFAKTGTTGDDEKQAKSKLFVIIISEKNIADPDFNFRDNKFVTVYFTSQNGPAKQNEKFQAEIVKMIEGSPVFKKYMNQKEKKYTDLATRE